MKFLYYEIEIFRTRTVEIQAINRNKKRQTDLGVSIKMALPRKRRQEHGVPDITIESGDVTQYDPKR